MERSCVHQVLMCKQGYGIVDISTAYFATHSSLTLSSDAVRAPSSDSIVASSKSAAPDVSFDSFDMSEKESSSNAYIYS